MNRLLVAGAVATGLIAAPAMAAEPFRPALGMDISSTLSMYVGALNGDDDLDPDGQPAFLGGSGAVNWNMMGYGVQLDVNTEAGIMDNGDYGFGTAVLGGHVYWRNPSQGLFGVLANFAAYGDGYNEYGYFRHAIGVEGQLYWGNITVYGQAALLGYSVDTCDCASSSTFLKAEGRMFLNQNAMIALRGEFDVGTIYDTQTYSRTTLAARGEMKFGATPFSLWADLAFSSHDDDGSHSFNDTTAKVGVTLDVGKFSLLDRDRTGVSLTQPFAGIYELVHHWQF